MISQHQRAAIIGYWRQGNAYHTIAYLADVTLETVIQTISHYEKQNTVTKTFTKSPKGF
jgi:hypothetical protein